MKYEKESEDSFSISLNVLLYYEEELMNELEITCQVFDDILKIKEELQKQGFAYKKEFSIDDTYFYNKQTGEFSIREGKLTDSLVVRYVNENDKKIICKKYYSNVIEKSVLKIENIQEAEKHLSMLGFEKMLRLKYKNYMYENEEYVVYLQEVKDLGVFIELEAKEPNDKSVDNLIKYIKTMNLQIGTEFNVRKAELLYNKLNKNSLK